MQAEIFFTDDEALSLGYKDTESSGAAVSLLLTLSCGFSRANNIY